MNDLIQLKKELLEIETEKDLINWLEFATSHNYYTGTVWINQYNKNCELENIVKNIISDEEYLTYLCLKCDASDIFIFKNASDLIAQEQKENKKISFCVSEYDNILSSEEFGEIIYYNYEDACDVVDEFMDIPEHLKSYFNYESYLNDLRHDGGIYWDSYTKELIINYKEV